MTKNSKIAWGARDVLSFRSHEPHEAIKIKYKNSDPQWTIKYKKKNIAQLRKNLPEMQETWVPSLGQEDLLEKEMATHSNILAWKILWTEESGGVQSMGLQESDTT